MSVDLKEETTLSARIAGYLADGPDEVGGPGDRGRWEAVVDSDDLLDLAGMARRTGGSLAADFRPVAVAFLSEVLGNMVSEPDRWHGPLATAEDVLRDMGAVARDAGVPFPEGPAWTSPACLAWDGSPDSPMDTVLAFADHARIAFSMESLHGVGPHFMGYPGMHVVTPVTRDTGHAMVTEMTIGRHLDGAGSRDGMDRWGRAVVRLSWDADGIRFAVDAATAEGIVIAEALAGPVFPFPRELGKARERLARGWFSGTALPTLRGYLADMDDERGSVASSLVGTDDLDGRIDPGSAYGCWLSSVRLAGARLDPGTGKVPGWGRVGSEVAAHFVDALHDGFVQASPRP